MENVLPSLEQRLQNVIEGSLQPDPIPPGLFKTNTALDRNGELAVYFAAPEQNSRGGCWSSHAWLAAAANYELVQGQL